jgi:hypothetical protein
LTAIGLATFWAIFFKKSNGHLVCKYGYFDVHYTMRSAVLGVTDTVFQTEKFPVLMTGVKKSHSVSVEAKLSEKCSKVPKSRNMLKVQKLFKAHF